MGFSLPPFLKSYEGEGSFHFWQVFCGSSLRRVSVDMHKIRAVPWYLDCEKCLLYKHGLALVEDKVHVFSTATTLLPNRCGPTKTLCLIGTGIEPGLNLLHSSDDAHFIGLSPLQNEKYIHIWETLYFHKEIKYIEKVIMANECSFPSHFLLHHFPMLLVQMS